MIRLLLISTCLVIVLSCNTKTLHTVSSKKVSINGTEMLYGSIDQDQLYFDFPEWKIVQDDYKAFPPVVDNLKRITKNFSVEIFLGTWCSDSKREVPHFFKIIEAAELQNKMKIEMWAVDRKKQLENGLARKRQIEFVPTFIFYKDGKEVGRIVETPENLLEQDMLQILNTSNGS